MKTVKVLGVKDLSEFKELEELIKSVTKGVDFPCEATYTGEYGDRGNPIVLLPNGREVNVSYLITE